MLEQLNLADIENVWGGSKDNKNSGERKIYFDETRGMAVTSNATFFNFPGLPGYTFFDRDTTRLQQDVNTIVALNEEHRVPYAYSPLTGANGNVEGYLIFNPSLLLSIGVSPETIAKQIKSILKK